MSILTTAGCRFRQIFIRLGRRMRPIREQTVEEGVGALFSAAQLLRANRLKKPLVVVGPEAEPWRERLLRSLEESDVDYAVWDGLSAPPTADDGENIRLYWLGERCDSFLALGGAGTLDIAKAAAARAACRGRTIMGMVGQNRVPRRKTPPVIAVPTEAGSGVESLAAATVADERGNRFVIEDRALVPAFAVLDPEALGEIPRPVLAEAVMDGLCLAVEAYLSGYADDAARSAAAKALQGFFTAAEPCWNDGGTVEQRAELLTASRLAGYAASRAGSGYARSLCRAAEKVSGVGFSEACAVMLPVILEKYGNNAAEKLSALSALSGVLQEGARAEKTEALISRIRSMAFRIGLPDMLQSVAPEAVDEIADLAAADANPRCACPVVWTAAQCAAVLRDAIR